MSRWPWVPKPAPGITRSSLITRSALTPIRLRSWYRPKEKVCLLSSQLVRLWPRVSARRIFMRVPGVFPRIPSLLLSAPMCDQQDRWSR